MSEVKLPFDLNPILNTYHHLAHPLGIISGNIPDQSVWFPWFAHKYINCEYSEGAKLNFLLFATDKSFVFDGLMDRIEFRMNAVTYEELFGPPKETFIDNIKKALDKGFYIRGIYNEKYISAMPYYQKGNVGHDYIIYGYSDSQECFFSSGYTSDRIYKEYQIPFFEYYDSIFQPRFKYLPLSFIHFNKDTVYETDYSTVLADLNHYLNSTSVKAEKSDTTFYGISAWQKLIEYLSNVEYIDIRFTKIFMEHHKLMKMRLEYFAKEGMIDPDLCQQYSPAFNAANQVYLLSIKYDLAPKPYIKENCITAISTVIEIDKTILPLVIKQIEEKKSTN